MKNAIAYLRVSTEGQEDKYGLDAQREAVQKYADQNGYNIITWYEETGSGAHRRPILDGICLSDVVENPPIEAIIVYKNDRIARDVKLYYWYLYNLEKKGISLIATQEDMEGLDPAITNFLRSVFQFVAEQERQNITKRTMAGRKVKAQLGGYAGGRVPYGYYVVGHELVIDEVEGEMVRKVFEYRDEGLTMTQTVMRMCAEGYRTRKGSPIGMSNVQSIRRNEKFYRGYYRYDGGAWVKGRHEPLLPEGDKE